MFVVAEGSKALLRMWLSLSLSLSFSFSFSLSLSFLAVGTVGLLYDGVNSCLGGRRAPPVSCRCWPPSSAVQQYPFGPRPT